MTTQNQNLEEKVSIFNTLKYSGEHFFINSDIMKDIKKRCDHICVEYQKKFRDLSGTKSKDISFVDDILFRNLRFPPTGEMDYERRVDIQDNEYKMIKEACKKKNIHEREINNIVFSLGYKTKDATFKKPCVAVVGQTKSGKSSLINSILQDRVVPQKVSRQTARVTYVTHCPTRFVAHMLDSRLLKIEVDCDVKDEDVDLQFNERSNEDKISIEIRVGTNNRIIQNGFDIVDCPGLNENPKLNELCAKMEKSLLPLLIFVVDGRNGLTQVDIHDIKEIKTRTPQLKIMYFATKLARSKYDRLIYIEKKTKKGLKDGEELPGESDIEVADRRLNKVLKKLRQHSFVPPTTVILESKDFNGTDLWAVNEMRVHSVTNPSNEKTPTGCDKYNVQLMDSFEENLMMYLKDMLEKPMKEAINYIQTPLEEILEKSTSLASEIAEEKSDKQKSLKLFREKENEFYETELHYIERSLRDAINKMIEDTKIKFVEIIEDLELASKEKGSRRGSQIANFARFEEEVKRKIEESLDEEIKSFVTIFMVNKERRLWHNLCRIVKILTKGKYGNSSFEIMLRNRLIYEYEFFEEMNMIDTNNSDSANTDISYNSKSVKRIVELVNSKGSLAKEIFKIKREDDENDGKKREKEELKQDDKQWREKLTERILSEFDRVKFLKTICDFVTEDFQRRHKQFVTQLEEQQKFLEVNLVFGDKEKQCVRAFAEQLGVQYARALHVKTPLYIMINPLIPPVKIGEGGQAIVEKVQLVGSKKKIVVKTYEQTFKDFTTSERLPHIAMEIYYSSRLRYRHCLELLGINFEETSEGWRFSAYYPFLKMGSLKGYLEKRSMLEFDQNLKERMELCLEVADGIQFLHKLQIVHRDVNLKNILVRKFKVTEDQQTEEKTTKPIREKICEVEAVISDYGLTKSFGFIEHTDRVGTLLYIAPELFNQKNLVVQSYNSAVDVFSFGICAWQLLSYRLVDEYANYWPKFAKDCEMVQATVEKLVIDGERPEDRDQLPATLNKLLKRCWHANPDKRPSFIKPYKELPVELDPSDHMGNKTILDELNRINSEITVKA